MVQLSGGREKSQTKALRWMLLGDFKMQQTGPYDFKSVDELTIV